MVGLPRGRTKIQWSSWLIRPLTVPTVVCFPRRGHGHRRRKVFAKLKLLKAFDFYKTRTLTPEQRGWLQFVCDRYVDGSQEERRDINSFVSPEISFLFFMFGKAMAVESVRERDEGKVFSGLISLSIENRSFDWRESLIVLSLLYHSAAKIAVTVEELFRRAAALSSSQTGDGLLQFLARTPENRDITRFGFKEGTDAEGKFSYVGR